MNLIQHPSSMWGSSLSEKQRQTYPCSSREQPSAPQRTRGVLPPQSGANSSIVVLLQTSTRATSATTKRTHKHETAKRVVDRGLTVWVVLIAISKCVVTWQQRHQAYYRRSVSRFNGKVSPRLDFQSNNYVCFTQRPSSTVTYQQVSTSRVSNDSPPRTCFKWHLAREVLGDHQLRSGNLVDGNKQQPTFVIILQCPMPDTTSRASFITWKFRTLEASRSSRDTFRE